MLHVLKVRHLVLFPLLPLLQVPIRLRSSAAVANGDVPPPTTLDDSDIRHMLDHVLTVQAAHGHILVDVLDEIRALRAEFAQF